MSVQEQIRQLNDARKLVLGDVKFYPDVVKGLLPIVQPSSPMLELRRWGADFLAEAFATPALSTKDKETMQVGGVLDTLETVLNNPNEDLHVLRSVILTCASIYPITLRWTIENSYDNITWQKMQGIKSRILTIWDTANLSIQICCVKFAQRVVLAQTPTTGVEPRRGDGMDVSLDKITPNHGLLDPRMLEAEAHGLLDRILGTLQDSNINPLSGNGLLIDATFNCLAILVRSRQNIGNRILNVALNYDPYRFAHNMMTPRDKVMMRSISKTVRVFFIGFLKRDPQNPFNQRIHQRLEWLTGRGQSALDEAGRKRPLEPPNTAQSDPKRQRIAQAHPPPPPPPPPSRSDTGTGTSTGANYSTPVLGPGPHSLADIFTLSQKTSDTVKDFDVHMLPAHLVSRIVVKALATTEPDVLERKIADIRKRLDDLRSASESTMMNPNTQPLGVDDDDDYEPDFYGAEDNEQMLNKMDSEPTQAVVPKPEASLSLEAFKLPTAPPLTQESALGMGQLALRQVFEDRVIVGDDSAAKKGPAGWRQFAANSGDRDSWITTLIRIASRSPSAAGSADSKDVKPDMTGTEISTINKSTSSSSPWTATTSTLNDYLRDMIFKYIVIDFRKHIDVAVSWLCEEWYNDRVQARAGNDKYQPQYHRLALRVLDGFLPYLHPGDKVLTRFLSEIPELSEPILTRVKQTCRDPTVVSLVLNSLLYLVMMRPPVKELALDAIQGIWLDVDDARSMAGKYLAKFRSEWLKAAQQEVESKKAAGSVESPSALAA